MKIAILQFTPVHGDVRASIEHANALLYANPTALADLDLLVLPELAFTGYNFPSRAAIEPLLEPTGKGPSTEWAKATAVKLNCTVAVGYPELCTDREAAPAAADLAAESHTDADTPHATPSTAYNSLVFVSSAGATAAHYRKTFLYYTDELWATEPRSGFLSGTLPLGSDRSPIPFAAGICMDINPYKFEAPWTAFEFASHVLRTRARLVVLSMAWLSTITTQELASADWPLDGRTVHYWIERFRPLTGPQATPDEVILVFANRTGEEGTAARIGEVRYAGSSAVMGMRRAEAGADGVQIWDLLGRTDEAVLVVDTHKPARYVVTSV